MFCLALRKTKCKGVRALGADLTSSNSIILTFEIKLKIIWGKYCFVFEFFVPLQCQSMRTAGEPLKEKIARFKSRNCAH